jgi:hypothetical protein
LNGSVASHRCADRASRRGACDRRNLNIGESVLRRVKVAAKEPSGLPRMPLSRPGPRSASASVAALRRRFADVSAESAQMIAQREGPGNSKGKVGTHRAWYGSCSTACVPPVCSARPLRQFVEKALVWFLKSTV